LLFIAFFAFQFLAESLAGGQKQQSLFNVIRAYSQSNSLTIGYKWLL